MEEARKLCLQAHGSSKVLEQDRIDEMLSPQLIIIHSMQCVNIWHLSRPQPVLSIAMSLRGVRRYAAPRKHARTTFSHRALHFFGTEFGSRV